MVAMVRMTALSVFANVQIVNRREGASRADAVQTGDPFEAPWHIARDLAAGGLAKADDPRHLDEEPADPVEPHPSLSVADHRRINDRRGVKGAGKAAGAVTGQMLHRQSVGATSATEGTIGATEGAIGATRGATGADPTPSTTAAPKTNVPPAPPPPAS